MHSSCFSFSADTLEKYFVIKESSFMWAQCSMHTGRLCEGAGTLIDRYTIADFGVNFVYKYVHRFFRQIYVSTFSFSTLMMSC